MNLPPLLMARPVTGGCEKCKKLGWIWRWVDMEMGGYGDGEGNTKYFGEGNTKKEATGFQCALIFLNYEKAVSEAIMHDVIIFIVLLIVLTFKKTIENAKDFMKSKLVYCVLGSILREIIVLTSDSSDDNKGVLNHLVEIQADDHDLLVNSDNENDDMLGYESEKYFDDKDANGTNHAEDTDGTNHSDMKPVKRGITRLYKFLREYGKHGGLKIKGYFDVDLTVKKLVMHHL
nr:hypothetical protein [Tanacetum cinerariifolium]